MLAEGWLTQTVNESQHEPSSCPTNNKCPSGVVTLPDGLHGGLVDVTNSGAMDYVWSSKHQNSLPSFLPSSTSRRCAA